MSEPRAAGERHRPAAPPRSREAATVTALLIVAALHAVPGVVAFTNPDAFIRHVADFGASGAHYVRDVGVGELVAAAAAVAAAAKRSWRSLAILLLATHLALHTVSHLIDASRGTSDANVGVAIVLAAQAVLLVLAARSQAHA